MSSLASSTASTILRSLGVFRKRGVEDAISVSDDDSVTDKCPSRERYEEFTHVSDM